MAAPPPRRAYKPKYPQPKAAPATSAKAVATAVVSALQRNTRKKKGGKKKKKGARMGKTRLGFGVQFDAFHANHRPPLASVGGGAIPLRARKNGSINIAENTTKFIVVNGGLGPRLACAWTYNGSASATLEYIDLTSNMFSPEPDTCLMTKCSFTLIDQTKNLDRGGHIKVLRLPQSLIISSPITVTQQNDVLDFVRGHPSTHLYHRELGEHRHRWDSYIVDGLKYQEFHSVDVTAEGFLGELDDPRMSTLIFLFETFTTARSFEWSVATTGYVRYKSIGPMAALEEPIPSTTHDALMGVNRVASAIGSVASEVGHGVMSGLGDVARAGGRMGGRMLGAAAGRAAAAALMG